MKKLLLQAVRPLAWLLVIVGVLFTLLKAFLIGVPALCCGALFLWLAESSESRKTIVGASNASPNTDDYAFGPMALNHDPSSSNYVPNDADVRDPLFRSFTDRPENDEGFN